MKWTGETLKRNIPLSYYVRDNVLSTPVFDSPVNLLYMCNLQWYSTCPHCLTWPLWVRNEGADGTAAVSINLWTQPRAETSNVQSVRRPTSGIAASTGTWSTSAVRRPVSNARTACTQGNTGRMCTRTSRAIIAIGRYTLWTLNRGETVDAVRPRPLILPLFLSTSLALSFSLYFSLCPELTIQGSATRLASLLNALRNYASTDRYSRIYICVYIYIYVHVYMWIR